MEYNILSICMHHTDFETGYIESASETIDSVSEYIKSVIEYTIQNNKTRYYKVKRNSTEVINLIRECIEYKSLAYNEESESDAAITNDDLFDQNSYEIVKRLIDAEDKGSQRSTNLKFNVKKGSLIQAKVECEENKVMYVLAKIDYTKFLDKKDSTTREGLPIDQKALKTGIIKYDEEYNIENIMLYDTKGSISEYWYSDFLELEQMNRAEENTFACFNSLDKCLKRHVKSKSPSDYWQLYNGVLQYFKQNEEFNYEEMVEKVFSRYEAIDRESIILENIVQKVEELPNLKTSKFEKNFTIKNEVLKTKRKKTIPVHREIDIILKDSIENLKEVMYADIMENEKYVLNIVVGEDVYNQFKK